MNQLTQLFADAAAATNAYHEAVLEVGAERVRMFQADAIRVSDLRSNATEPATFRRSGQPLHVVQTDFP